MKGKLKRPQHGSLEWDQFQGGRLSIDTLLILTDSDLHCPLSVMDMLPLFIWLNTPIRAHSLGIHFFQHKTYSYRLLSVVFNPLMNCIIVMS